MFHYLFTFGLYPGVSRRDIGSFDEREEKRWPRDDETSDLSSKVIVQVDDRRAEDEVIPTGGGIFCPYPLSPSQDMVLPVTNPDCQFRLYTVSTVLLKIWVRFLQTGLLREIDVSGKGEEFFFKETTYNKIVKRKNVKKLYRVKRIMVNFTTKTSIIIGLVTITILVS